MSVNFTGITFANQKVSPSDDAIIRRAILPDGILTGCDLSYSGSTLTMAAGQLMVCGRQIRHPAANNWAVVDATSGYARLLLTIDLTRTSTKDAFEQVVDTIEYASAVDGFPDLEQADINGAGTRYQVEICVVSLGTGGISGIVSQIGNSAVDSAGGLNFKVVGGTTQPSDPKTNTIWVNTDTAITGWAFSSSAPGEPEEGMVWIATGSASPVAFNAAKKNTIMVYPVSAQQYVRGAWTSKNALLFTGDDWISFSSEIVWIYNNGVTPYTWIGKGTDTDTALVMSVVHGTYGGSNRDAGWKGSEEQVTVPAGASALKMIYSTDGNFSKLANRIFGLRTSAYSGSSNSDCEISATNFAAYVSIDAGTDVTVSLPITDAIAGNSYYIGLQANSGSTNTTTDASVTVSKIWIE